MRIGRQRIALAFVHIFAALPHLIIANIKRYFGFGKWLRKLDGFLVGCLRGLGANRRLGLWTLAYGFDPLYSLLRQIVLVLSDVVEALQVVSPRPSELPVVLLLPQLDPARDRGLLDGFVEAPFQDFPLRAIWELSAHLNCLLARDVAGFREHLPHHFLVRRELRAYAADLLLELYLQLTFEVLEEAPIMLFRMVVYFAECSSRLSAQKRHPLPPPHLLIHQGLLRKFLLPLF